MAEPVLAIERLTLALPPGADRAHAVENLSLAIGAGETLCVVGESGSGKSLTAHAVMGLLPRGVRPVSGPRTSSASMSAPCAICAGAPPA